MPTPGTEKFIVELTYNNPKVKITAEQRRTIAQNICDALLRQADEHGLTPDEVDGWVEHIHVSDPDHDFKTIIHSF
jgi:hypothetical protein